MGLASRLGSRFKAAFASEIVGVIAGGLLIVLLARLLSPDSYGVLFLAISVFSVARLFSVFGIPRSAGRYLSEYKETDQGQIPHILRISFIMNMITISVVSILLVIGKDIISNLVGVPTLSSFLVLGGFFIIAATISTYVRIILQSLEYIQIASLFVALTKLSRALFAVGFVILGFGAIGALVGYIISYALIAIIGLVYIYLNFYSRIDHSVKETELKKKIAKYAAPIAITQSAHSLDHHIDKILVGFFVGPAAVAYYTLAKQIIQFIQTPLLALGFTLSPTYNSLKTQGNSEAAAQIYESALSYGLLFYIPAAAGVILLAEPAVNIIFGGEYINTVPILKILAIFVVLKLMAKLTSDGLDYLGRARERAALKVITAILNVILNIVMIPWFGVIGAALATVMTYSIYTFGNIYLMYQELEFNASSILKISGYALVISGLMSIAVIGVMDYIVGIVTLSLVILFGVTIWAVLVLFTGLVDVDQFQEILL